MPRAREKSTPTALPVSATTDFDEIKVLAVAVNNLQKQMAVALAPKVLSIIQQRSRDVAAIEATLDQLLSCAGHSEGLKLFKSLCRHYYDIDPAAAARHVYDYREMWDSDSQGD
jgi:hypothetical protein